MDRDFYFERLYPLQDTILQTLSLLETGFYLSGGTGLSRGYLQHRFSDDLDLFVNDDARFGLWSTRVIDGLTRIPDARVQILTREERFTRIVLVANETELKLELINDVPAHVGAIADHPVLGRLDSAENIFSNKLTAIIDRREPKDFADIWGLTQKLRLPVGPALEGAHSKAAGIFPADLARALLSTSPGDWEMVRWIDPPPCEEFLSGLHRLAEELLLLPPKP